MHFQRVNLSTLETCLKVSLILCANSSHYCGNAVNFVLLSYQRQFDACYSNADTDAWQEEKRRRDIERERGKEREREREKYNIANEWNNRNKIEKEEEGERSRMGSTCAQVTYDKRCTKLFRMKKIAMANLCAVNFIILSLVFFTSSSFF